MSAAEEVPLFPLNTVLFPGGLLPLRLFEQRYLEMAKACLRDGSAFGVCLIREGAEVGTPATPVEVGCLVRIVQWDMQQLGLLQITVQGEQRFRILERRVQGDGLALAAVERLSQETDAPVPEGLAICRELMQRIAAEHGERLFAKPIQLDSSVWVSARLAEILPLPTSIRQQLLELDDGVKRLEILQRFLKRAQPSSDADQ